jgi:hypothetical protein
MKRFLLLVALAFAALPVLAAEDFSGKWSGTFTGTAPDGTQITENMLLILVHKGAELTGTAGPNEQTQWKIQNGKVDGNKLSFLVQNPDNDVVARISLGLSEGHLKGEFAAEKGSEKMTAKVDLTRVK